VSRSTIQLSPGAGHSISRADQRMRVMDLCSLALHLALLYQNTISISSNMRDARNTHHPRRIVTAFPVLGIIRANVLAFTRDSGCILAWTKNASVSCNVRNKETIRTKSELTIMPASILIYFRTASSPTLVRTREPYISHRSSGNS